MLDDYFDDDDAHEQKAMRLESRVQAMIGVLEMEFQATPADIVTTVVTLLADRDPVGMAEHLTGHVEVLKTYFMSAPSSKPRLKSRRR